jgi:pullulanase/glycogen debranching enzyme
MLLGGDEFARTQGGNNSAYRQDNNVSWFDWDLAAKNDDLVEFFRKAIGFVRGTKQRFESGLVLGQRKTPWGQSW